MVDETSEQKGLKDRVALPLLIKHAAPLIDGVLGPADAEHSSCPGPCRRGGHDSGDYPAREEGGFAVAFRCAVANGVMLRSSATLNKWQRSDIELSQRGSMSALMCSIRDVSSPTLPPTVIWITLTSGWGHSPGTLLEPKNV